MKLPSQTARERALAIGGVLLSLAGLLAYLNVNPFSAFHQSEHLRNLARDMYPPRLQILWEREGLLRSIFETLAMAFAGTSMGIMLALPAGLLGASNTAPHPGARGAVRTLLSIERSISSYFILMVLLVTFGLGPFAGTVTLSLGTLGTFGKMFAETIERVDAAPAEAIAALGATRWQQICFGILPDALPSLVANSLFAFDYNLRIALALGIFGAGGLGSELLLAISTLRYRDVLALSLIALVIILTTERISEFLRNRI